MKDNLQDELFDSDFSLVIGPDASSYEAGDSNLMDLITTKFGEVSSPDVANIFEWEDELIDKELATEADLRKLIADHYNSLKPGAYLHSLVKFGWKSVISLAADTTIMRAMSEYYNSLPTSKLITVVNSTNVSPSVKDLPFFNLLGDASDFREEHRFAVGTAEYLTRRRNWSRMLKRFTDYNKNAGLLFLGTDNVVDRVADLVNELLLEDPGLPKNLYFLDSDPCAHDKTLIKLVQGRSKINTFKLSQSEFVSKISSLKNKKKVSGNKIVNGAKVHAFKKVADKLSRVPTADEVGAGEEWERNRILDYLFRPSHLEWIPFKSNYDFVRPIVNEMETAIEDIFEEPGKNTRIIWITGEAGVGKTTSLKRVAYNLSNKGYLPFWIHRSDAYTQTISWAEVIRAINTGIESIENAKIVFFYDGAAAKGDQINELVSNLYSEAFDWCLVSCHRHTDEAFSEVDKAYEDSLADKHIRFPMEFDESELEEFPEYLVKLNMAKDVDQASSLFSGIPSRNSSDALCLLWYLLPETRSAISTSLADEYYKLGGIEGAIQAYAKEAAETKDWARHAYELVGVISSFDLALPIEVLVNTLGVAYEEWIESIQEEGPLWGILYDESYGEGATWAYRTRNHIVTKVLVGILNTGPISHTGEFRILKEILESCDYGSSIYRELVLSILVSNKKTLKDRFTYQQGLELYDTAISAFPYPDKTIAHHRGLWVKNVGGKAEEAYQYLKDVALNTDDYPHSNRIESNAHIHTSIASSVVSTILSGKENLEDAMEIVRKHLNQSESSNPFDLHNRHVSANMYLRLAEKYKGSDSSAYLVCMADAATIISTALSLASNSAKKTRSAYQSFAMLSDLQQSLFQLTDSFEENKTFAQTLYEEKGLQTGFYALLKTMISEAERLGKGKLYKRAEEYFESVKSILKRDNVELSLQLVECRADLAIKWHLVSGSTSSPDWELLARDLNLITGGTVDGRNVLWCFYLAVSLYHLNAINEADAQFKQLRRLSIPSDIRRDRRCSYLDEHGNPKDLQGVVSVGATGSRWVYCSELKDQIMCSREFKDNAKATIHFNVIFSLQGPLAIKSKKE